MNPGTGQGRWRELLPTPGRLWLRWLPEAWPSRGEPWTDLGRSGLAGIEPQSSVSLSAAPPPGFPDVVALPPVAESDRGERATLGRALAEAGWSVVWLESAAGCERDRDGAGQQVLDLLGFHLAGSWPSREVLGRFDGVIWPYAAGLGDDSARWREGIALCRAAGVGAVVPIALELDAMARRALVERAPDLDFGRVFHGSGASEDLAVCQLMAAGLSPFLRRPPVPLAPVAARNRELATLLGEVAELWLRCGRSEAAGLELWRAVREIESATWDLSGLAREGALGALPWLGAPARAVVEAWASQSRPALLAELEAACAERGKEDLNQ